MKTLILGNGQLGQMLGQASVQLGHECLLVNTRSNEVMATGMHVPVAMNLEQAMSWADIVSWEHEQLAPDHVKLAADKLLTDPDKILPLTHRQLEKQLCDDLNVPTSPWVAFDNSSDFATALENWQGPAVIKAATGGYDGKSQWRYNPEKQEPISQEDFVAAGKQAGIIEAMIPFQCEMSIVGARSDDGRIDCFPLVENVHTQGILSHTLAAIEPVPEHLQRHAEAYFQTITEHLGYVGTLAIEFFVVGEGEQSKLLVNEIAPRVHNSGHWSLTGASISQFELHMRALTNMPFPEIQAEPTLMVNAIGCNGIPDSLWAEASASPFWYGKDPRPGRKVGHVNFRLQSDTSNLRNEAEQLCSNWCNPLQILS